MGFLVHVYMKDGQWLTHICNGGCDLPPDTEIVDVGGPFDTIEEAMRDAPGAEIDASVAVALDPCGEGLLDTLT